MEVMWFSIIVADGVALGAAVSTSKTEVEVIVFVAIMLHKVKIIYNNFLGVFSHQHLS